MKCDKLQRYSLDVDYEENAIAVPDDKGTYMDASDVDDVLAEKDEEIYNIKYSRDEWAKACNQKDKEIAQLQAMLEERNKQVGELIEKHKTEVKELLCLIRDKENNFNRAFDSVEKELRHHKYRRCLDKAKLAIKDDYLPWNMKWRNRWLELAEKFKEAK